MARPATGRATAPPSSGPIADRIDARTFNLDFPQRFPRFVQHAIWRYCAALGRNVCNGNRLDDRGRCSNIYCQIYSRCDRIQLAIIKYN